ncbi:hypothetical protein D9M71_196450 [compost metagenome]
MKIMERAQAIAEKVIAALSAAALWWIVMAIWIAACYQFIEGSILGTRLGIWSDHGWYPLVSGWAGLRYAWPFTALGIVVGVFATYFIDALWYEAVVGKEYREKDKTREADAKRRARAEYRESEEQLARFRVSCSLRLEALERDLAAAEVAAERERFRADVAESRTEYVAKQLAEAKAQRSRSQGAAERHRRKHRHAPDDNSDEFPRPPRR